jgi:hypothetical protein
MKVAFVASDAAGLDGWGRYTAELVGALRSLDVEPVLITAGSVGEALTDLPHYPILPGPFEGIGTTPRSLLLVPKVRRIVADCNLIHCMTEHYMPLAALVSGGKPLVMLAHGTWAVRPLARRWLGWLFRWAIRRADLVIGVSRYTLDRMAHYVSLRRTLVRSGGVRIDDFARPVAWRPPAWAKGARVALGVGAIKARKGYHVAIEAVREALDELPNLHYVIVGGLEHAPGYVAQLREQIERLGLAGRIHLLGRVPFDELVGWYQCPAARACQHRRQFRGLRPGLSGGRGGQHTQHRQQRLRRSRGHPGWEKRPARATKRSIRHRRGARPCAGRPGLAAPCRAGRPRPRCAPHLGGSRSRYAGRISLPEAVSLYRPGARRSNPQSAML